MALRFRTRSEEDTYAFGRALGAFLRPGDALLLSGDLGTGKSVLARGAARALGVEGPMPSPSFTIMFPYEGECPVYHFDLYRLSARTSSKPPDWTNGLAAGACAWWSGRRWRISACAPACAFCCAAQRKMACAMWN